MKQEGEKSTTKSKSSSEERGRDTHHVSVSILCHTTCTKLYSARPATEAHRAAQSIRRHPLHQMYRLSHLSAASAPHRAHTHPLCRSPHSRASLGVAQAPPPVGSVRAGGVGYVPVRLTLLPIVWMAQACSRCRRSLRRIAPSTT